MDSRVTEVVIFSEMIQAGIQALREERDREATERDTVLAVYCAMHSILAIQAITHESKAVN